MTEMKLACAILGEGTTVLIKIARTEKVGSLKEAIFAEKRYMERFLFPASELTLYLARKNGQWLPADDNLKRYLQQQPIDVQYTEMNPTWELDDPDYFGQDLDLGTKCIHVVVQLPHARIASSTSTSDVQGTVDSTSHWLASYRASWLAVADLPSLGELAAFIDQALTTKISLSTASLTRLRQLVDAIDPLDVLEKLFVENNYSPATVLDEDVLLLITHAPDGGDWSTHKSWIAFLEPTIRVPLCFVVRDAHYNRASTVHPAATPLERPDVMVTLDSVCVFRGEEQTAGVDLSVPREELRAKMLWLYGDAPYLFAYIACGPQCQLLALTRGGDDATTSPVAMTTIGTFHLHRHAERFRLLLALIQIGRLLESLASQCPSSAYAEYSELPRSSGEIVLLGPMGAQKDYCAARERDGRPIDFARVAHHVKTVYGVLQRHRVPHVDQLVHISKGMQRIELRPRGLSVKPTTLSELFCALRCVLEALVVLHQASWMHRDISWGNVLQQRDGNAWFLIDFEDAAPSPQASTSASHLNTNNHAPEMFVESGVHTTAVDLWSVGFLIETCSATAVSEWGDERARRALKNRLMDGNPAQRPSAEEARGELKRLEAEYFKSQETT